MNHFELILQTEEKYDNIIETAQNTYDKELKKFKEFLEEKEKKLKEEYLEYLNLEYNNKIRKLHFNGKKKIKEAEETVDKLEKNLNYDSTKKFIILEVKNLNV